ncbi:Transducin/WD40 repeat-like superfamily protein [Thalictrum thalictroides]|uniref:Transducin/WD40 repeat-like superfamily protein n=1 Tax=Thalictrum thalictroides TaxID=46969 RepID=A0A7J6X764_THATH|nr:Transducin/WD40 repeat-like superfamily protein [Thalictrum thalictroides]
MEQFNSKVSFLKFWKDFKYDPRNIRFSCDTEDEQGKKIIGEVNLPQFSAAIVPKIERMSSDSRFSDASNDFVLYVGGHVWALDWCPSVHQQSDCRIKCELLLILLDPLITG